MGRKGNLAQRSILARILVYDDANDDDVNDDDAGNDGDVARMSAAHGAEIKATVDDVLSYFSSLGVTGALFCTMTWPLIPARALPLAEARGGLHPVNVDVLQMIATALVTISAMCSLASS